MRLLFITAGAAGIYCGSCFRDNALAAELMARGHDVTLLPLYTPTRTDEDNVSDERVFFGGVSVYLQQHFSLFRRTPRIIDRLWDSKPVLRAATRLGIRTDPKVLGELTLSMLRGEDGYQRKEVEKLVEWLRSGDRPEVVILPNSLLIGLAKPLREALGAPICCTLQGEELFLEGLPDPYRAEAIDLIRRNVRHVDAFEAVSNYCASFMRGYLEIPQDRIHVLPLGINLKGYDGPRPRDGVNRVGYFARIAPEKGLHVLAETHRILRARDLRCKLEVAGYLGPEHRGYLEAVEKSLIESGLGDDFSYRGVLDRNGKIEFLKSLDLLSVPATYDEPKGMFLLEAMAGGTPVVQPRRGAFTEIVETTGGGLLVEPDNPEKLADGIERLIRDRELAESLGRRGQAGVREHYGVAKMAENAIAFYSRLARRQAARAEVG